jgi:hypothetical protein
MFTVVLQICNLHRPSTADPKAATGKSSAAATAADEAAATCTAAGRVFGLAPAREGTCLIVPCLAFPRLFLSSRHRTYAHSCLISPSYVHWALPHLVLARVSSACLCVLCALGLWLGLVFARARPAYVWCVPAVQLTMNSATPLNELKSPAYVWCVPAVAVI